MIDLDNPTHSCQRGCNTPVRALRVTMGAAENVDDVTALKLAHASLKDMGEGLMRSLLTGLLTATAADKPACFVAVRVARSIVQHISECDASEAHPRHTSDSNSLSPVPRLDLGQRQEGEEGGGRRAQDARPASVQNGPDRATAYAARYAASWNASMSRFPRVKWSNSENKFRGEIRLMDHRFGMGSYTNEEDGGRAMDAVARLLRNKYPELDLFPEEAMNYPG